MKKSLKLYSSLTVLGLCGALLSGVIATTAEAATYNGEVSRGEYITFNDVDPLYGGTMLRQVTGPDGKTYEVYCADPTIPGFPNTLYTDSVNYSISDLETTPTMTRTGWDASGRIAIMLYYSPIGAGTKAEKDAF